MGTYSMILKPAPDRTSSNRFEPTPRYNIEQNVNSTLRVRLMMMSVASKLQMRIKLRKRLHKSGTDRNEFQPGQMDQTPDSTYPNSMSLEASRISRSESCQKFWPKNKRPHLELRSKSLFEHFLSSFCCNKTFGLS